MPSTTITNTVNTHAHTGTAMGFHTLRVLALLVVGAVGVIWLVSFYFFYFF
jgi:hypothetical protein